MIFKTFQKESVQFEKKTWQNEPIKHLNFHAPHSEYTFEFSLVQHEEPWKPNDHQLGQEQLKLKCKIIA